MISKLAGSGAGAGDRRFPRRAARSARWGSRLSLTESCGLVEAGARTFEALQTVFLRFPAEATGPGAIAEIHCLGSPSRNYHWVFEADIACFDEIDHTALMERVRRRVRQACPGPGEGLLRLVFSRRTAADEQRSPAHPKVGSSRLLANIALSVLDEHFTQKWEALGPGPAPRRRAGEPGGSSATRDDFVVMVHGTRDDAEALSDEVAAVLAPMGLRLSEETRVCHIDEGFDFLGWRIQRRNWRGRAGKKAIYTYPSKKSLASIIGKIRLLTRRRRHRTLADLLRHPTLRGWCNYFRHGVSTQTFGYVDHFAFWRIVGWLKKRHVGLNTHTLVRRYLPGWRIHDDGIEMFRPERVAIERYRYRGTRIPTPWTSVTTGSPAPAA